MQYVLYHSKSALAPTDAVCADILRVSIRNNSKNDLTGFLHQEGPFFLQYLEGPQAPLMETLARIRQDPRHFNLDVLDSKPIKDRVLPDWSMGSVSPQTPGLSDLLDLSQGHLDLSAIDPFDLVVFMANNASHLRHVDAAD